MRKTILFVTLVALFSMVLMALPMNVVAPTKIVPTDGGAPGHPFTIVDTPEGRLTDGCKAVFKGPVMEVETDLRTHNSHKVAQGRVPEGIFPGEYIVFVRVPDGSEFEIGPFMVYEGD
jgi:hypothetical protein